MVTGSQIGGDTFNGLEATAETAASLHILVNLQKILKDDEVEIRKKHLKSSSAQMPGVTDNECILLSRLQGNRAPDEAVEVAGEQDQKAADEEGDQNHQGNLANHTPDLERTTDPEVATKEQAQAEATGSATAPGVGKQTKAMKRLLKDKTGGTFKLKRVEAMLSW